MIEQPVLGTVAGNKKAVVAGGVSAIGAVGAEHGVLGFCPVAGVERVAAGF